MHIIPLYNVTEDAAYQNICTTIDQFITMTLNLLGEHEVVYRDDLDVGFLLKSPDRALEIYSEENSVDNIVFGFLERDEDSNIVISISLYDCELNEISVSVKDTAYSIFDVFDVSEGLLTELIGSFSNIHIGFGSIYFDNRGEDGSYDVYFNGTHTGTNLDEMEKVLNGDYQIEIKQNRFGEDVVLYSRLVSIRENQEKEIIFSIPFLTEDERLRIKEVEKDVDFLFDDDSLSIEYPVVGILDELLTDMDDLGFCPPLDVIREPLRINRELIDIEFVLRSAITAFNAGDEIPGFSSADVIDGDQVEELSLAREEAVETIFVLKRLRSLAMLSDKKYEEYLTYTSGIVSGPGVYRDDFLYLMNNDRIYVESLYRYLVEDRKTRDRREFVRKLEEYYGEIWEFAVEIGKDRIYRAKVKNEFSIKTAAEVSSRYRELDAEIVFIPEVEEKKKGASSLLVKTGGNALASVHYQWHPQEGRGRFFGFRFGLGVAYNEEGERILILAPLELDFHITKGIIDIYSGIILDFYYDGNFGDNFADSPAFNFGLGIKLNKITLYLDNKFYAPDIKDGSDPVHYSPSIGIGL